MITQATIAAALLFALQSSPEATNPPTEQASATEVVAEQTAEATQEAEEERAGDRVICRRTTVVGSRFSKRICATQEEWDALTRRSKDTTREFQRRGKGNEPPRG